MTTLGIIALAWCALSVLVAVAHERFRGPAGDPSTSLNPHGTGLDGLSEEGCTLRLFEQTFEHRPGGG